MHAICSLLPAFSFELIELKHSKANSYTSVHIISCRTTPSNGRTLTKIVVPSPQHESGTSSLNPVLPWWILIEYWSQNPPIPPYRVAQNPRTRGERGFDEASRFCKTKRDFPPPLPSSLPSLSCTLTRTSTDQHPRESAIDRAKRRIEITNLPVACRGNKMRETAEEAESNQQSIKYVRKPSFFSQYSCTIMLSIYISRLKMAQSYETRIWSFILELVGVW